MKVMSTDTGIEIAVTRVERIDRRNTRITITAKTRPSRPSVARLSMDCWMNGAWSNTTVNFVLWPIDFSSDGIASCTAFDTATVLPEDPLKTATVIDGSPLTLEIPVTGLSLISTVATFAIVFGAGTTTGACTRGAVGAADPGAVAAPGPVAAPDPAAVPGPAAATIEPSSGSSPICCTEVIFDPACTVRVLSPSVMEPDGSSVPFAPRASRMAWVPSPAAASLSASGVITMRCPVAPSRVAWLTPASCWMSVSVDLDSAVERSLASRSLVTEICTTGRSPKLKVSTCGSTPCGRRDEIRLIALCTFCSAVAMLVP